MPRLRGFGRAPRGTAVPLSSESVRGLGRLRNAPAAFGYFPPVESNEGTVLSSRTTVRLLRDLDNTNFPDCGTKRCALEPRYFPAMESTQRYGRRGVSNPPSCTSPQRPLIRRGGWLLGAIRYAICRGGPSGCIAGSSLLTVDFLRDTMAKEGSFDRCFPEDITKSFPHFPLFFPQNKGFFRKETIDVVVLPCRRG